MEDTVGEKVPRTLGIHARGRKSRDITHLLLEIKT
jgi:hypothetical protein